MVTHLKNSLPKNENDTMESNNGIESALANLIQISTEKGFLLFDDIYDAADKWCLSIRDIDYLSSSIVTRGILVYDDAPTTGVIGASDDDFDDFAQRDYEAVFDKVIELDPGLEDLITTIRNIVPPQAREMDQLKYQVQEGNSYARERVIQMHLRFAVRIALQRAETYDLEIADTIQEACIGLILAVDKYDPDSSGPFGSYASLWILQNIGRAQGTQRPTVHYPVHKKEGYYIMYPILKKEGYLDYGDIWSNNEAKKLIQDKLGCTSNQAEDIIDQCVPIESLDDVYSKYLKNIEVSESCYDDNKSDADLFIWHGGSYENIEKDSLRAVLEEMIRELKPREQEVIKARYGFDNGEEKTLEEVGRIFGVTRERIRQIESKAIRKLQLPSRMRIIEDYL